MALLKLQPTTGHCGGREGSWHRRSVPQPEATRRRGSAPCGGRALLQQASRPPDTGKGRCHGGLAVTSTSSYDSLS
ncbi:unnamed protein product [Merluccius merluccius]